MTRPRIVGLAPPNQKTHLSTASLHLWMERSFVCSNRHTPMDKTQCTTIMRGRSISSIESVSRIVT
ncbi:hypothetical protein ACHHYP_20831 [Achlya hypogyna]|uniref:Uncharacterized protein n=1 Tax=Achlya hypogyna TaxID=1202772 RepID=A0A1V9ZDW3_ACHHY|nr:hypothetical protein ACHHYP_20831 [Achlya hypogyna]